jgi:hypothetical protein
MMVLPVSIVLLVADNTPISIGCKHLTAWAQWNCCYI